MDSTNDTSPARVARNISWEATEWDRIMEAAKKLGAQEHLDLGASDIIRAGTRKHVAEILGSEAPA